MLCFRAGKMANSCRGTPRRVHFSQFEQFLLQGTVMRDKVTQMGTQSMCALYKPDNSSLELGDRQDDLKLQPSSASIEGKSPSHTGSEPDWENDISCPKNTKGHLLDQQCLKVRDRGKSVQHRWRQKLKVSHGLGSCVWGPIYLIFLIFLA